MLFCGNLVMQAITSSLIPSSLRQFFTFSQSPKIQIFVEDYWNITLAYDVSLDATISSLKAAIEEAEGKPVARQCLKFQGQELKDTSTFSSYNISDGSIVQLARNLEKVFVKTLVGKTITCDVDLDAPTLFLKLAVQDSQGIPPSQQRLIFKGKYLDDHQTLASYEVQKEDTFHLTSTLRGGGPDALAYAVACRRWDGDMKHRFTKGLKLSHRGMMVVITEMRDKNWYSARELDNNRGSEGVIPCHFVHIVKYLNNDFRRLDLNPSPEFRSFPFRSGPTTPTYYNAESETKHIKDLGLNNSTRGLPRVPSGPLPPFRFPWAEPRIFSRGFANRGHSLLEISITYNPEAVPSDPTLLNVTFKCRAIGSRVSEASIQVTVPNGEVKDVRSPPVLGREGETQAKFVTRNEQSLGVDGGFHGVGLAVSGTRVTEEERSGTLPTTQMSITGDSLRGDTASWLIKEAATLSGGEGLPARLSDMSFTLAKQPEEFIFDCLVRLGGGKKYYLKLAKPRPSESRWFHYFTSLFSGS